MRRPLLLSASLLAALLGGRAAAADPAPFDLTGPTLSVTVTHQGKSLPIAQVPQLSGGDRIDIHADLPSDQSAHYLLIAAFLRGSTNPPPDKWFTQSETWKKNKKARAGLSLTVPDGAQQMVLFLAPETGGDFPTLRNAVQGRPGAFVRATQDLAQASLDHSRLDTYLGAVRKVVPDDPDRLPRIAPLLARSLQVKVNDDCLTKIPSLQSACLLQNQEALVLNDGHSNAITEALAGPGSDLALQLAATPQGGLGYYSPYIAAIRDIVGIFSSIHTAKYQYIPALATLDGDQMRLLLNAPPSFHNPKSVLVAPLPVVAPVHVPPLQVPEASPSLCLQSNEPLLPMSGAPLVYSTRYAHDLSLRVKLPDGREVDLPATPDVEKGGLRIAIAGKLPAGTSGPLEGGIHGVWGFQPFDGPVVRLQVSQPGQWRPGSDGPPSAGGTTSLVGGAAACVTGVTLQSGNAAPVKASWKKDGPDRISISLPAGDGKSALAVQITGPGDASPDRVVLAAPRSPARLGASMIAHDVQRPAASGPVTIALGNDALVPSTATFTLSLRTDKDARLTGQESIEIAAASGGDSARLSVSNGLTFVDDHVVITTLQPARLLGPSAFGALKARIVRDGAESDWLPIGTLVRLPTLSQLQCPAAPADGCTLSGDGLFLIDSLSATPGFEHPQVVPAGYASGTLRVPRPADGGALYLRLHDAPDVTNRIGGATP
jgi:hypothetical protein